MATGGPGAPTYSKPQPTAKKKPVPVSGDHAPQRPTPAPAPAPSSPSPQSPLAPPPLDQPAPQPAQSQFTGKPNPILQALGYFGAVQDLERRLGTVRSSYQQKFGVDPPPGLAFDVARSSLPDEHLSTLIDGTPGSIGQARSQAAVQQVQVTHPYDFFQVRSDGLLVQNNPLLDKVNQYVDAHPLTMHEMYPTVQMGTIPIADAGSFMNSIQTLDKAMADGTIQVTDQGVDLSQFEKEVKIAGSNPSAPGIGAGGAQTQVAGLQQARKAVETVKQAQIEPNREMGTSLPVTGFINQTWGQALGNWMKTTAYYQRVVQYQAQQAGFGHDVGAYVRAWTAKQDNVRKHGLFSHFLNAMPLQLFGHGLSGEPGAVLNYLKGPGYSWKSADFYTTMPLHAIQHSTTLTVGVLGGSIQQAKADAAATNEFAYSFLGKGMTIDQSKKRAAKALAANPNWLRVIDPSLPEHPTGWEAKVMTAANLAGDLILLRKPAFTGETVGAGDAVGAAKSGYLDAIASDAHKLMKNGDLNKAYARLEGGRGSGRLVDAAIGPIQRGEMSAEQFRAHVGDLYQNGYTVVNTGSAEPGLEYGWSGTQEFGPQFGTEYGTEFGGKYASGGRKAGTATGKKVAQQAKTTARSAAAVDALKTAAEPSQAPSVVQHLQSLVEEPAKTPSIVIVHGPIADSLRTKSLPTPGAPGAVWQNTRFAMRALADSITPVAREHETGLRNALMWGNNTAAKFISNFRVQIGHVVGQRAGYFDPRLPERVFNDALRVSGDPKFANDLKSVLIRAQARDNVSAIQAVDRKLQEMWQMKNPKGRTGAIKDPFEPTLETELPSVFSFHGNVGHPPIDNALRLIQYGATKLNASFNNIAKKLSRVILATPGMGFVLGWKHAFGDTMRRYIGGGIELRRMNESKAAIDRMAAADPAVERAVGAARARTQLGEQSWLLDRGGNTEAESFTTGDKMGGTFLTNRQKRSYMTAAGGYVRRMTTSDAVHAYQMSSATDISPIVDLIKSDRNYRTLYAQAQKAVPGITIEDYAGLIRERFKDFENATVKAGIGNPFGAANQVIRGHRGAKADQSLGKWIEANGIDMPIKRGLVTEVGPWDDITGRYLKLIMTPNKWNRVHFFDNVLHKTFGELRGAGMKDEHALEIALSLAEKQTNFHMLDFANRLQVEQNLRWLSYFATKHRLYWKWVLGTMVRRPGTALAVADARNSLDGKGNINFTLPFRVPGVGSKFSIPAARLFWVPGKEYSETSPIVQFVGGTLAGGLDPTAGLKAANGTNGNVLTRSDNVLRMAWKLGSIGTGHAPATYGEAVRGLPASEQRYMNRAINEYQTAYMTAHGHYADESAAVKHVLWHQMGQEYWRANLPLPVLPQHDANAEQKLVQQFMLLDDPAARRKFLDAHPGVADHFGVYTNPNLYLHNRVMFGRYQNLLDNYHAARTHIFEQALQSGMTGSLALQLRKLGADFQKQHLGLLNEDAGWRTADGDKTIALGVPGSKPTDKPRVAGPWGRLVQADPQLDPYHQLNALFPNLHNQQANVIGQLQTDLQHELDLMNNPDYAATYPDPAELKTRRAEIQQRLAAFRGYPTDALGKVQLAYESKHVQPYWNGSDKRWRAIQKLPRGQQVVAYAKYRSWRDTQDKPVEVNGVKFPSPVRMAWATLDPVTKQQRLAKLAGYNWESLTDYEKNLLGYPAAKQTSEAWSEMEQLIANYQKTLPVGERGPKGYRDYFAKYTGKYFPGFYSDYKLSRQPSYKRLEQMPLITQSKFFRSPEHGVGWTDVLTAAKGFDTSWKNATAGQRRDGWTRYVQSTILPAIHQVPGFEKEVALYGPDFLNGLIAP